VDTLGKIVQFHIYNGEFIIALDEYGVLYRASIVPEQWFDVASKGLTWERLN